LPKLSDEKQQERRLHILDAAEVCFARRGFHRTTMNDICREAGVSAGAVYLYFKSKEALIEGLVTRDRDEFLELFEQIDTSDLMNSLGALLETCIIERPPEKLAIFLEIGVESRRNPAVAETMMRCDATIRASMTALLERAKADGTINPDRPVSEIVDVMDVIADGLFWSLGCRPGFEVATVARSILPLIAQMLRPVAQPSSVSLPHKETTS
jgi:AcrR family transcriptional regulator